MKQTGIFHLEEKIMWHLFTPEIPVLEKIIRSVVIYLFIFLAFRFSAKRQVGQLSPFDFVVLLIIANVVQNAVIGPDNSLGGGMIGAITILLLNALFDEWAYRSKRFRHLLEQVPTILVHNGKINAKSMAQEKITQDELLAALRKNGILEISKVRYAILEENGSISIIPEAKQSVSSTPA